MVWEKWNNWQQKNKLQRSWEKKEKARKILLYFLHEYIGRFPVDVFSYFEGQIIAFES